MNLKNSCIVLGICGSIAAYKSCSLISMLKKRGADVHVLATEAALKFIGKESLRALSLNNVLVSSFDELDAKSISHIDLAKKADLLVVYPASANTIAKLATGICDNMLTDCYLAYNGTKLIAPAMNCNMWENPISQNNKNILEKNGAIFVGPSYGNLACGDTGNGKLVEAEYMLQAIENALCNKKDFRKNIIVTAGPTIEMLDPVRYISNKSSGKMGYEIAKAAAKRGAYVKLICGPNKLKDLYGVEHIHINSTEELFEAISTNINNCDVLIQAAAPCDYKAKNISNTKIKKSQCDINFEFVETIDIAKEIGKNKKHDQFFVGFAAETDNIISNAKLKLKNKNLDMIVANDVSKSDSGFDVDYNTISIIDKDEVIHHEKCLKSEAANLIIDRIIKLINRRNI